MITSAALFTQNLYRPFIGPGKSPKHYLLVGRVASVVIVVGSIAFTYQVESVVTGLEIFWKVASMMGIAFWAGLFWRKATAAGAWASTLASFAVLFFTSELGFINWSFNARFAQSLPEFMLFDGKLYLPWQMILYLSAGLLTMIVVSLFTRPEPKEKIDRVYECIRTPIQEDEPEGTPLTLPPGVAPAPRSVLISHPDFEIPRPSRVGVIGFLATCGIVALIIASAFWLFSLGA
jgi:Na+/proline symporter